jgi:hypothetical protein
MILAALMTHDIATLMQSAMDERFLVSAQHAKVDKFDA